MRSNRSFGRRYLTHGEALSKARAKYPFRLVRAHSNYPDPRSVDASGIFDPFARFPSGSGDEWLFGTKAARDHFIATYGGTALGE